MLKFLPFAFQTYAIYTLICPKNCNMVRTYVKKGSKLADKVRIALEEVKGGRSLSSASRMHGVSRQIIAYHLKKRDSNEEQFHDKRVSVLHVTVYLQNRGG